MRKRLKCVYTISHFNFGSRKILVELLLSVGLCAVWFSFHDQKVKRFFGKEIFFQCFALLKPPPFLYRFI